MKAKNKKRALTVVQVRKMTRGLLSVFRGLDPLDCDQARKLATFVIKGPVKDRWISVNECLDAARKDRKLRAFLDAIKVGQIPIDPAMIAAMIEVFIKMMEEKEEA